MPELPEVEVTCRGIAPALTGSRVVGVIARTPALRYPLPKHLDRTLAGSRLLAVKRRGKYLLLDFGHGHLLIHLGMSGSLRLVPAGLAAEKHDHFDLLFAIKGKSVALRLRDPRRFGAILWLEADPLRHPLLAVLGVEPLTEEFSAAWLKQELAGLAAAIKPTLMDSHRVVGIGNIYASESLFRAGIDPRTPQKRTFIDPPSLLFANLSEHHGIFNYLVQRTEFHDYHFHVITEALRGCRRLGCAPWIAAVTDLAQANHLIRHPQTIHHGGGFGERIVMIANTVHQFPGKCPALGQKCACQAVIDADHGLLGLMQG